MKKKVFALAMVLVFLVQFVPSSAASTAAAVVTDPADWLPDVLSLTGSHSVTLEALNADAEYYEVQLTVTPSGGLWRGEFEVPDCYIGLDVWQWNGSAWVYQTGQTGYSLSVPYVYNFTDKVNGSAYATGIPADWGTGAFAVAAPSPGSLYRVQLRVDTASGVQLKVRIHYATKPAIGFDSAPAASGGDYIRLATTTTNHPLPISYYAKFKPFNISICEGDVRVMGRYYSGYSFTVLRTLTIAWNVYTTPTGHNVVYKSPSVNPLWYVDYMLALTYDGSVIKRYENTKLVNSTNQTEPLAQTASPWEVGGDGNHQTDTMYYGIIYDAAIYSVALTQDEINTIYAGGTVTRGLVARITPGSWNGTMFVDLSGNGNHGTAYGGVEYKVVKSAGFSVSFTHYTFSISGYVVNATAPIVESGCSYDPYYRKLELATSGNVTVHSPIGFYLPFWVYYDAGNGWVGFTGDYEWDFGYSGEASNVTYYFPSGTTRVLFDFADDTSGGYTPPIDGGGGGGGGGSTVTPPPPVHEEEEEGGDDGDGGGGEDTFPTNVVLWGGVAYAGLIAAIALILVMGGKKR